MKHEANLFGKALSDTYHNRIKGPFYVCDDAGRETPLDMDFYLRDELEKFEKDALNFATGKILDVGCGPGRVLKYLQNKDFDVTGFDVDSAAIQLCKERGLENVFVGDFNNIEQFGVFNTILFMNRTICTAGTLEAVKLILQKCYMCCLNNGILIFDSYEVKAELAKETPGIIQNKLWFKYGDSLGKPFYRVCFSSFVAKELIQNTGWVEEKIIKHKDIYCMLCRKK